MACTKVYHVVAVSKTTGRKTRLTSTPEKRKAALTIKSKFTAHPGRRIALEPAGCAPGSKKRSGASKPHPCASSNPPAWCNKKRSR